MLTDALRVMVNNPFEKNFYGKRKKSNYYFFFLHKNGVKTFLKLIVYHCLKGTR